MLQNCSTALIWACIEGHHEVVEVLIEAGANLDAQKDVSYGKYQTPSLKSDITNNLHSNIQNV